MPSLFVLFLSFCLCLSATRGAVSVIVFILSMWMPCEALSVTTCSVNKRDYIYFVHGYDRRMMVSWIQAGLMMSLLP